VQHQAIIKELRLVGGGQSAYIACDASEAPAPGRYLLAHESGSNEPLATELFAAEYGSDGFAAAAPIPRTWRPGSILDIRGPLGSGFALPKVSRRVALVAFDGEAARLMPLAAAAAQQGAAVALVCENAPLDVPLYMEVQPAGALAEVCGWSDYAAFDVARESVNALASALKSARPAAPRNGQVLVRTAMPCGGLAECGVCSVHTLRGSKLACVDGPVFDLKLLISGS
jgi:NAD(P)H-flavin reductase